MKSKYLLVLLIFTGCEVQGPSASTLCPCTVTAIEKHENHYDITVQGRATHQTESYTSSFNFTTTEIHQIGDIIK